MQVKLQWITPDAEAQIAYIARGSNPDNQENPEYAKLFKYCLRNGHWSPFQMASMCVFVETSLAVANQIKRHWSIAASEPEDVQELSMRYLDSVGYGLGFQPIELRKAGATNRQSSLEPLDEEKAQKADRLVRDLLAEIEFTHIQLMRLGVANECARMILPQATTTRFFLSGSCRSWIHYFDQRLSPHAQKEHREVAEALFAIFKENFPTVCQAYFFTANHFVAEQVNLDSNTNATA
jgi:thymidylate synthase (FAD)